MCCVMRGRKPIHNPEKLRIGQKLDLGNKSAFGHQYARAFNKRFPDKKFQFVEGVIKRIQ